MCDHLQALLTNTAAGVMSFTSDRIRTTLTFALDAKVLEDPDVCVSAGRLTLYLERRTHQENQPVIYLWYRNRREKHRSQIWLQDIFSEDCKLLRGYSSALQGTVALKHVNNKAVRKNITDSYSENRRITYDKCEGKKIIPWMQLNLISMSQNMQYTMRTLFSALL